MKRLILFTVLVNFFMAVGLSQKVYASDQSVLDLPILPLNCIFEQINDGSRTINYITPEACGVIVNKPQPNMPLAHQPNGRTGEGRPFARQAVPDTDRVVEGSQSSRPINRIFAPIANLINSSPVNIGGPGVAILSIAATISSVAVVADAALFQFSFSRKLFNTIRRFFKL